MKRLELKVTFLVFMSVLYSNAFAYDFTAVCESGQTLGYTITSYTEYTAEVSEALGTPTGVLIIPEFAANGTNTYTVTGISDMAFYGCSGITQVIIPNSVTSIGDGAFAHCSGLTEIQIPTTVTYVGNYVFDGCTALIEPIYTANIFIFFPCEYATVYTIPDGIQQIAECAFMGCTGLLSVTIPNSVTSIGKEAFWYCTNLTSVIIPSSVTYIGDNAFRDCSSIETIIVEPDNSEFDSRNDCNAIIKTSTNNLILGCQNTIIPNSVTKIGDHSFANCIGLTSIIIPDSVTSIGTGAFEGCTNLTAIMFPNSITSIGSFAFSFCSALAGELTIPNSVTSIGSHAFKSCRSLISVIIPNSVTIINSYTFSGCSSLTSLTIGDSVTSIDERAFYECSGLTSITLPNTLTRIGSSAFEGCSSLDTIYSNAINPPAIFEYTFNYIDPNIPVIVPCGQVPVYNNAEYWNYFNNIRSECNYTLSANSSDPDLGTVSGGGTYIEGSVATIEATANDGYAFLEWNDGNTNNPRTVEIISDTTFVATFTVAHTITIESSDSEMGTATGSGVYAEGAMVEITAVPNEGYRFYHWIDVENPTRDFNTDNPRTITVTADALYIAVFTEVVGIEHNSISEISIFPNPVIDNLNIISSEPISEIEIVNALGQVVYRTEVNADNAVCDVEGLTAGVYIVRIHGTNTASVVCQQKFTKE